MSTASPLDFERDIAELEHQIGRLQEMAQARGLDVAEEIGVLERKLERLKTRRMSTLSAIERVQRGTPPGRNSRRPAHSAMPRWSHLRCMRRANWTGSSERSSAE